MAPKQGTESCIAKVVLQYLLCFRTGANLKYYESANNKWKSANRDHTAPLHLFMGIDHKKHAQISWCTLSIADKWILSQYNNINEP
jgi:hypothetical protein